MKHFVLLFVFVACAQLHAQFIQQGNKLVGSGTAGVSGIYQGQSVSLSSDGNTAFIGGYMDNDGQGAAWVFTRTAGTWSQQGTKLVGTGVSFAAYQGYSVALSADGTTAVVGGILDSNGIGAVWVYTRSGSAWSQQGSKLVGTGSESSLGVGQGVAVAVSADGNTVLVGGFRDSNNTGAAWVFARNGATWSQQGPKLKGTGAAGNPIFQGCSVALSADGNTAIVGGYADSNQTGAAWVYTRSGGVWSQQGEKLVGTGGVGQTRQGFSVSLSADGNTALVGAPWDNSDAGAFWTFTRSAGVWSQQGGKIAGSDETGRSELGWSASLSGDGMTAMLGGVLDNGSVGAAWAFRRSGTTWNQIGGKLVGTGAVGLSYQGQSVSVAGDGSTCIVGGMWDSTFTGAAWVYTQTPTAVKEQHSGIPEQFILEQNYPNPFNPATTIRYQLPVRTHVRLAVFDMLGNEVATLVDEIEDQGVKSVTFAPVNLASGIYYYRFTTAMSTTTKKLLLIR